jgi:hypothetical protein
MSFMINSALTMCHAMLLFLFQTNVRIEQAGVNPWYIWKVPHIENVIVNLLIVGPILIICLSFAFLFYCDVAFFHGRLFINPIGHIFNKFSKDFGGSLLSLVQHLDEAETINAGLFKKIVITRRNAFAKWMKTDFTKNYENNVEGFAYWGAGVLIFLIGLRGIKFITAEDPSWIIFGLELECMMLILLGITKFYTPEEGQEKEPESGEGKVEGMVQVSYDSKLVIELIQSLKIFVEQFGEQNIRRFLTQEQKDKLLMKMNSLQNEVNELKGKMVDFTGNDSFLDNSEENKF